MNLKIRHSLTFRLTLLFAAASTAVLLALGYLIGHAVENHFEEQDVDLLASKIAALRPVLSTLRTNDDVAKLVQQTDASTAGHQGLAIRIITANGVSLFTGDSTIGFPQSLLNPGNPPRDKPGLSITWLQNSRTLRGIAATVPVASPEWSPALVAVAMDITHHQHFMAQFRLTLWGFVAIATLLMGLLGWFSARSGLAPLNWMKSSMGGVSANSLGQRLAVDQLPAELADLGSTLNGMLSRLEEAFERLSGFSSDIAHELRTPVSNLMTQTQVALSRARTADEYREILASNAEELDRMARMIADMLFLARSEHGLILLHAESVLLAQEFRKLEEFYEPLLQEKSIRLNLSGEATITGDPSMLRRAFGNLLSNAIRHAPADSEIAVDISMQGESAVTIGICNAGDIPARHLPHLFERFYRADPSRHRDGENTGLGLAITKSIIDAHHGYVAVTATNGKVCFNIQLPSHT